MDIDDYKPSIQSAVGQLQDEERKNSTSTKVQVNKTGQKTVKV